MTDDKKKITTLQAFPPKSYENFDLDRLSIYCIYVMQQNKIPLYFDYVAVGLFKLFPKKFSMANFSNYPDTYRINNSLRRLSGSLKSNVDKMGWVTGSAEHGFNITEVGIEIAKQVGIILKSPESSIEKPKNKKTRGRSSVDDVKDIKESDAFKKWLSSEEVSNYEFFAFLKATPYTPKPLLLEHLNKLKKSVAENSDKKAIEFINWLEKKFNNLIK
jgi:hypothetical protein